MYVGFRSWRVVPVHISLDISVKVEGLCAKAA